jgi:hypothetical protein
MTYFNNEYKRHCCSHEPVGPVRVSALFGGGVPNDLTLHSPSALHDATSYQNIHSWLRPHTNDTMKVNRVGIGVARHPLQFMTGRTEDN